MEYLLMMGWEIFNNIGKSLKYNKYSYNYVLLFILSYYIYRMEKDY